MWALRRRAPRVREQRRARSLRDRLRNHVRGPIATSTLRRSLGALLASEFGLILTRSDTGKLRRSAADEERLSAWMEDHARVGWISCSEPWLIEDALITSGPRLPLNFRGSVDPYRHELSAMRAAAGSRQPSHPGGVPSIRT